MQTKEKIQENQYVFPYHHLTHESSNSFYIFQHLFWGLEHYTYIKFVINQISKIKHHTLLDIGCGEGRIIKELELQNPNVQHTGIDISPTAIAFANSFTTKSNFLTHDITTSKYPDNFDIIISCEVIEHISPEKLDSYIKNISTSLKPGGYFIFTTPTTNVPTNKKHYQHFTLEILKKKLQNYFLIEEVHYLNRINLVSKILNKLLANRIYLSNIPWLNRTILSIYKKYLLIGTKDTGSRIFVKAKLIK
jgi:2-polyprenyl-3-methyl-5-hydroxy-6-metoxy-1,4-benzoquinol methylase